MAKSKHVMLIVETSKVYGRRLLDGIGRYALANGPWSLYVEERGLDDPEPTWLCRWHGDGVIFRGTNSRMIEAIRKTGIPAVNTNTQVDALGVPLVYTDDQGTAEIAAEHFLERHFQHLAFCAIEEYDWVVKRRDAYLARLADAGISAHCFSVGKRRTRLTWDEERSRLTRWARSLPKPVAVLAANDVCGMRLIDACRDAGIRLPEELAVLGVDNDELLCRLASPPMSSIDLNTRAIGERAAEVLDQMMMGRPAPESPVLVKPLGCVTRQSTDILAVEDAEVVQALIFIRQNACEGITVENVLDHLAISRATLDRKFSKLLGRSAKAEILRMRLEQVKRLLRETEHSLPRIAAMTGFKNHIHLSMVFKRTMGQPPGRYRGGGEPPHSNR
jgi:LacI family transcriptional regulator